MCQFSFTEQLAFELHVCVNFSFGLKHTFGVSYCLHVCSMHASITTMLSGAALNV